MMMRNVPGMIYVKLRSALSICDTWPAFFVMNSSYIPSHCGGSARIWPNVGGDALAPGFGIVDAGGGIVVRQLRVWGERMTGTLSSGRVVASVGVVLAGACPGAHTLFLCPGSADGCGDSQ
jgi:hypothetical protein